MMNKDIFVTGGTGFVGSYILRYLLAAGFTKITALKRASSSLDLLGDDSNKINWIDGDILDVTLVYDLIKDKHWVFHCAAMVSFIPRDRNEMLRINVEGTTNVVNACIEHGIHQLIYLSSVSTLGKKKNNSPITEQDEWEKTNQTSKYSISKYLAEIEVRRAMAEGLSASILNPSIIIGAGRFLDHSSSALIGLVAKGLPQFPPGSTGFVDVRDVAQFAIQLALNATSGENYVLNAENLKYKTIFESIAYKVGAKIPGRTYPLWMIKALALLEKMRTMITGKAPLITRETIQSAFSQVSYDNQKSLQVGGFSYRIIEQTLQETCELYLNAMKEGKDFAIFDLN